MNVNPVEVLYIYMQGAHQIYKCTHTAYIVHLVTPSKSYVLKTTHEVS